MFCFRAGVEVFTRQMPSRLYSEPPDLLGFQASITTMTGHSLQFCSLQYVTAHPLHFPLWISLSGYGNLEAFDQIRTHKHFVLLCDIMNCSDSPELACLNLFDLVWGI